MHFQNVQFYWEAYVYFYQSDIALDDIKVTMGSCSGDRTVPESSKPIAKTTQRKTTTAAPTTTTSPTTTTAAARIYSSKTSRFKSQ